MIGWEIKYVSYTRPNIALLEVWLVNPKEVHLLKAHRVLQ